MPSAAEVLLQHGVSMQLAHDYVLYLASYDPHALLTICEQFDITNAMLGEIAGYPGEAISAQLVASYFASFEIDSSVLDNVPGSAITVSSAADSTVTEGGLVMLQYTLSGTTAEATEFAFSLGGNASLSDFDSVNFSSGVSVVDAGHIRVEAGQGSVTLLLHSADDTSVEGNETFSVTLGGKTAVGTINDNDSAPPASSEPFIPAELASLADVLRLDGQTGTLSQESLRADILAHTSEAHYWELFDVSGYAGADDGVFTNAEVGWQLGNIPTDAQMMESLFFGTLIHALKSIDDQEFTQIGAFLFNAGDSISDAELTQFIALLDDAFSDTPTVSVMSDADIHTAIVEVAIDLVAMVDQDPSIFHGLLNWAL